MCSMRIRKVARRINLMGFYLYQQVDYQLDVVFAKWLLLHCSRFVKRHVEKVHLFIRYPNVPATCFRFTTPDQSLDAQHFLSIYLPGSFAFQRLDYRLVKLFTIGFAKPELFVEVAHE